MPLPTRGVHYKSENSRRVFTRWRNLLLNFACKNVARRRGRSGVYLEPARAAVNISLYAALNFTVLQLHVCWTISFNGELLFQIFIDLSIFSISKRVRVCASQSAPGAYTYATVRHACVHMYIYSLRLDSSIYVSAGVNYLDKICKICFKFACRSISICLALLPPSPPCIALLIRPVLNSDAKMMREIGLPLFFSNAKLLRHDSRLCFLFFYFLLVLKFAIF